MTRSFVSKVFPTPPSTAVLAMALVLAGCGGYVPGRQSYWDQELKDLCEKEGAVSIVEPVLLSKDEAQKLPRTEGKITLRVRINRPIDEPVFAEISRTTYLRQADPEVRRTEMVAIRQRDQKIVARWVEFSRVGGDFPTALAHHSSFHCPDPREWLAQIQPLFIIRGD